METSTSENSELTDLGLLLITIAVDGGRLCGRTDARGRLKLSRSTGTQGSTQRSRVFRYPTTPHCDLQLALGQGGQTHSEHYCTTADNISLESSFNLVTLPSSSGRLVCRLSGLSFCAAFFLSRPFRIHSIDTFFCGFFIFGLHFCPPLRLSRPRSLVASLCLGSSQQYVLPYLLLVAIHSNPCNISFTRRLCHQPFPNCPLFLSGVDPKPDQSLHTTRRLETCCFTHGSTVISNTLITSSRGPEPSKAPQEPPTVFSWPRTLLFPWAVSPTQPRYRLGARSLVHNLPYSSTRILKTKTPGPAFCYLRASG